MTQADENSVMLELVKNKEKLPFAPMNLQTVIPKLDNCVMVLKPGIYYQKLGIIESLQKDNFSASVMLMGENTCLKLKYTEFSKVP